MAENDTYQLLGLGLASKRLVTGDQAVYERLVRKKLMLVIVALDAGLATQDRFHRAAERFSVKLVRFGNKERLGACLGQAPRAVVGVIDLSLADALLNKIQSG